MPICLIMQSICSNKYVHDKDQEIFTNKFQVICENYRYCILYILKKAEL